MNLKRKLRDGGCRSAVILILFLILCMTVLPGCGEIVGKGGMFRGSSYVAGKSVQGRDIECVEIGEGADVSFILGAIHGDEPASNRLSQMLVDYLGSDRDIMSGRKVIIVPTANPDGLAAGQRYNANGVDINRNFEASNRLDIEKYGRGLSEPESRVLQKLILRYNPARIASLHQPYGCIDYDGPGKQIAEAMGERCDLEVKKLGARPGSLGAYAGISLGIPIVTVEMFEEDSELSDSELWDKYGQMILAFVVYPEKL